MLNVLKSFMSNEDGLEMVEWAVVAAVITTGGAAVLSIIGTDITTALQALQTITGGL